MALVKWLGYNRQPGDWNCEIHWLSQQIRNNRHRPQVGMLGQCFAATVYQVWAERNRKRFSNQTTT